MSNDAPLTDEALEPRDDDAPKATDHADDLSDLPAAAGGQDQGEPAQGEGEHSSY
ncbi:hypothetical protein [Arsenicicoccus dermatophilus]|uniref:hypothetical protein n=1 Tax=Arsenicicoccus dermatophilus TaxID=1076331 RepID=UPI0039174721